MKKVSGSADGPTNGRHLTASGSGRSNAKVFPLRLFLSLVFAWTAVAHADENDWRVPFITTPGDVVERMLELAGTRAGDLVADLGSGDGRIVIAAARKYGARGLGIELDEKLVQESRENARKAGVADRVKFVQGDVLIADFSPATVVTVYLLPGLIGQLEPRFLGELKPGTRIVSHSFRMASWRPDRMESLRVTQPHPGQGDESTIYLWIVPADVRGTWIGSGKRVTIEQNYQEIDVDGARGSLAGNVISWGKFRGRVAGNRIVGDDGLVLDRQR
jgi:precorrin-6B methylase 2